MSAVAMVSSWQAGAKAGWPSGCFGQANIERMLGGRFSETTPKTR
jgi:hypothetical protein